MVVQTGVEFSTDETNILVGLLWDEAWICWELLHVSTVDHGEEHVRLCYAVKGPENLVRVYGIYKEFVCGDQC